MEEILSIPACTSIYKSHVYLIREENSFADFLYIFHFDFPFFFAKIIPFFFQINNYCAQQGFYIPSIMSAFLFSLFSYF